MFPLQVFSFPWARIKDKFCLRSNRKSQRYWPTFCLTLTAVKLCMIRTSHSIPMGCPQKCICPNSRNVQCTNKFLRVIPGNISRSVLFLDLSGNLGIKITRTSFEKFKVLTGLKLESCGLSVAFTIPHRLSQIHLQNNKITFKEFYTMFYRPSPFLRKINVSYNKIDIISRQPLMNKTSLKLKSLTMDGNYMKRIYKQTFSGFYYLEILSLIIMGIENIEKDAFSDLTKLTKLSLFSNKLVSFPKNLFKPLGKLIELDLEKNKLQAVPNFNGLPRIMIDLKLGFNNISDISTLSEMGVESVKSIQLWYNNITTLPKQVFRKIFSFSINLSFNKIKHIKGYSFTACTHLAALYLDFNQMTSLSINAFRSVQHLQILSLSNNNISVLPPGLFTNLSMYLVLLHNNNLSSTRNTWKGIRKAPTLILLFDNPFRIINGESLKGLGNETEVLISCDTLLQVSGLKNIRPIISCSQSRNFDVVLAGDNSHAAIFRRFGFVCGGMFTGQGFPFKILNFTCIPCPLGYYGTIYDGQNDNICQKCPAGSFYQDKLIQTTCKRCPIGQYVPPDKAPGKGPLDCKTCPAGTRSDKSANYRGCFCLPGFARLNRFGSCTECTVPGIKCDKDYQMLKPGFWWSWEYNKTCKAKYLAFIENLETFNEHYSTETTFFNSNMPLPQKCPNKVACLGTVHGSCHQNYTGPLCAMCAEKYYRHFKMCVRCPKARIVIVEFLAYFLAFVVICLVINWADKIMITVQVDAVLSENTNKTMPKQQNVKQRTVADILLSTLKIVLGFYQVLNGTVHSFSHLPWPKSLNKALMVFRYIELEVLRIPSLRCIKTGWIINAIGEFWLSLIITFLMPISIGAYYTIRKLTWIKQ